MKNFDAIAPTPDAIKTATQKLQEPRDSLFERVAWVYTFCREHLFRDDTENIITALWPNGSPVAGTKLIELGCGPGFYSRRLARRFPDILVQGVDRSERQLHCARQRAQEIGLHNCSFTLVDVLELPYGEARYDALIASRLFTILSEPDRAIAEIYRVLKPRGRCFIAEPRYVLRASIPLFAMWMLARVTHSGDGYREPRKASIFSVEAFKNLFAAQAWQRVQTWQEGRYQYALCEKG